MFSLCLENCPRIEAILKATTMSGVVASPIIGDLPFFIRRRDDSQDLESVERDAEECPGPLQITVQVIEGLLHKKTVPKIIWKCELDQEVSSRNQ